MQTKNSPMLRQKKRKILHPNQKRPLQPENLHQLRFKTQNPHTKRNKPRIPHDETRRPMDNTRNRGINFLFY